MNSVRKSDIQIWINLFFAFLGFFIMAVVLGTIPLLMTSFQETFAIGIADTGVVQVAMEIGFLLLNAFGVIIMARSGLRISLTLSFLIAALGCTISFLANSYGMFLAGIFLQGSGYGLGLLSQVTSITMQPQKYQKLSFFFGLWGVGGITATYLVQNFLSVGINFKYLYLLYSGVLYALAILSLMLIKGDAKSGEVISCKKVAAFISQKNVIVFGVILCTIAAGENVFVTWAATAFEKNFTISKADAASVMSYYWLPFTVGRLIGDGVINYVGRLKLMVISLTICLLAIMAVAMGDLMVAKVGVVFISLGICMLQPAFQGFALAKFESRFHSQLNAFIFLSTGLSCMLFIWLGGVIGHYSLNGIFLLSFAIFIVPLVFTIKVIVDEKKVYPYNLKENQSVLP